MAGTHRGRLLLTGGCGFIGTAQAQTALASGWRVVLLDARTSGTIADDAGLLDHLIITILPTALGEGIPLFSGLAQRAEFAVERVARWGPGFVQVHLATHVDEGAEADA